MIALVVIVWLEVLAAAAILIGPVIHAGAPLTRKPAND